MKSLLLVGVAVLLGCTTVPTATEVWEKARSQTVLVEDRIGSLGTGVVINKKCVVTAAHVADVPNPTVTTESGKVYLTRRVVNDGDQDVAVLCTDKEIDAPAAKIGPTPPPYSYLFTIGFPVGFKYILTEGRQQEGGLVTTLCAPGNSGGGVFDEKGHYIGFVDSIVVYRSEEFPIVISHLCNIVRATTITHILDENDIHYKRAE
jgi:S1-C subfamily serine protease